MANFSYYEDHRYRTCWDHVPWEGVTRHSDRCADVWEINRLGDVPLGDMPWTFREHTSRGQGWLTMWRSMAVEGKHSPARHLAGSGNTLQYSSRFMSVIARYIPKSRVEWIVDAGQLQRVAATRTLEPQHEPHYYSIAKQQSAHFWPKQSSVFRPRTSVLICMLKPII